MNKPGCFAFPPTDYIKPVTNVSGATLRTHSPSSLQAVSADLDQTGAPKSLYSSSATPYLQCWHCRCHNVTNFVPQKLWLQLRYVLSVRLLLTWATARTCRAFVRKRQESVRVRRVHTPIYVLTRWPAPPKPGLSLNQATVVGTYLIDINKEFFNTSIQSTQWLLPILLFLVVINYQRQTYPFHYCIQPHG